MKVTAKQNVWGNWYGYVGGRRAAMFFGTEDAQAADAKQWVATVSGFPVWQRREALAIFKSTGVTQASALAQTAWRLPEPRGGK